MLVAIGNIHPFYLWCYVRSETKRIKEDQLNKVQFWNNKKTLYKCQRIIVGSLENFCKQRHESINNLIMSEGDVSFAIYRSNYPEVLYKKAALRAFQNLKENTCNGVL